MKTIKIVICCVSTYTTFDVGMIIGNNNIYCLTRSDHYCNNEYSVTKIIIIIKVN